MAARKFKFVSPGVFLKEIDQSQLPRLPGNIGPILIGRTRKGPALRPTLVNSYEEFVQVFGDPVPGNQGEDVWRDGNGLLAPAYTHYAAKAYFAAGIDSPVTVVRLLGITGDNATGESGTTGAAGWEATTAYGLFLHPSGSSLAAGKGPTLAAIFYSKGVADFGLKGKFADGKTATGAQTGFLMADDDDNKGRFLLSISGSTKVRDVSIDFTKGSPHYIRDVLNTNPVMTNGTIASANDSLAEGDYWLGETFEETVPPGDLNGFIVKLKETSMEDFEGDAQAGRTGWVISQDEGPSGSFDILQKDKLFRAISLSEGEEFSKNYFVAIEDIRFADKGDVDPYGSFSVIVKQRFGTKLETVESFTGCTLNPNSQNYVGKQVGDQYVQWSSAEKRNKVYGNYPNRSRYIRVEMDQKVDAGLASPSLMPFGFLGPVVPDDISFTIDGTGTGSIGSTFVSGAAMSSSAGIDQNIAVTASWPAMPLVVSASVRGTDHFGASIYEQSNYALTSKINMGAIDYIRRLPNEYNSAQVGGTETRGSTKHAFLFSLDDVVVEGSNLTSIGSANVTDVFWMSGSRRNTAASATLKFTTATAADFGDTTPSFTLISADGLERTYEFENGGGDDNGAVVTGTTIRVNAALPSAGSTSQERFSNNLKAAIEGPNGHGFGGKSRFVVTISTDSVAGDTCTITQVTPGEAGNTIISAVEGGATNEFIINGDIVQTKFAGGSGGTSLSYTAVSGSPAQLTKLGFNKFIMPLVGGFDGVDITEADPFANQVLDNGGPTTNYAYASVDRAIELIRDPEAVEFNLAAMPGITNTGLTDKLVQTCESRADAMAIIDLPNVYLPAHEKFCTNGFQDRIGTTPENAAQDLKNRSLNSSYGAAYYPWVKIADTENSRELWAPPSVVALGVMAYTEKRDEVWFAPAGFNRGGLNEGNAGIPVLQVSEQLLSKQRDTLYEANINPIASFVTEGLVIFGQKTLQSTPSALDRINVRRLLIFVKKEVSRIASNLLFDQNVPATWNRFLGQVNPFLQSVKTRLGLSDFKVILDNSTTTPDLVDRNIMYAKIFLKPARSIEFIAVDFVITNTGASFDD